MNEIGIDVKFLEGKAVDYEQAIRLCADCLLQTGYIKDSFVDACLEREQQFPTGLPLNPGVAIPHADSVHVKKSCLCLLRLTEPVQFRRIDNPEQKIDITFVICIAIAIPNNHNVVLAHLIKAFQDNTFTLELESSSPEEVVALFKARMLTN